MKSFGVLKGRFRFLFAIGNKIFGGRKESPPILAKCFHLIQFSGRVNYKGFVMRTLIYFLFLVLSFNTQAIVGVLVEPYFGVATGDWDNDDSDPNNDYKISGTGYGARLGAYAGPLMGGLTYNVAGTEAENKGITGLKVDYDFKSTGIFLGYKGMFVDFWYTYYIDSTLELGQYSGGTAAQNTIFNTLLKNAEFEGDGWSLGLGLKLIPYVKVFAELHAYKYDKYTINGTTANANDAGAAYWLIGASFPIELL